MISSSVKAHITTVSRYIY